MFYFYMEYPKKILQKEGQLFLNGGCVWFEKQHLPAGTGRVELLGPFFFIFLAIFYFFLLFHCQDKCGRLLHLMFLIDQTNAGLSDI